MLIGCQMLYVLKHSVWIISFKLLKTPWGLTLLFPFFKWGNLSLRRFNLSRFYQLICGRAGAWSQAAWSQLNPSWAYGVCLTTPYHAASWPHQRTRACAETLWAEGILDAVGDVRQGWSGRNTIKQNKCVSLIKKDIWEFFEKHGSNHPRGLTVKYLICKLYLPGMLHANWNNGLIITRTFWRLPCSSPLTGPQLPKAHPIWLLVST